MTREQPILCPLCGEPGAILLVSITDANHYVNLDSIAFACERCGYAPHMDDAAPLRAELAAANARAVRAEGEALLAHECNDRLQIYLSQAREQAQANAQFHAAQMAEVTQARDKAREALALFLAYCDMDIEGPASPIEMFDRAEQAAREVMGGEK